MIFFENASTASIQRDIENIDKYNSSPGNGTTRILFTKEEMEAREYIKSRMREIGLEIREDAIGNIFGTLKGSDPELKSVWTGSHIDTVANAGKFDGMAGVVAAIEALRLINNSGKKFKRNIEAVVFTSEEPARFRKWGLGSNALAGNISLSDTFDIKDNEGNTLASTLESLGYNLGEFNKIREKAANVHSFVELHIEQAPILEEIGVPIGVVQTICAPTIISITVKGSQGHAGSTPKDRRREAVLAMAEIALKLESIIATSERPNFVGTVGKIDVFPNESNVIPREVIFTIDVRDSIMDSKDELLKEIMRFAKELEVKRQVEIKLDVRHHDYPVDCDKNVIKLIQGAAKAKGYAYHDMVSGAFHDALSVASFAPIGMIFVPCKGGISHSPAEWAEYEDIAKGADVLTEVLYTLANS